MTSAEARAVAGQQIGQDISGVAPQIILVASISGGTGSGMLLDAAYVLRKLLADCSLSHARLTGVLLHSTGRSPHDKLLARANACACLRELERFGDGEGYPGDADFGLPASAADVPPLDAVRVLYLGDGLNGEEFAAAAENVAQFLDLATATAGSVFFDADDQPDWPGMAVRTCGMCRVGRAEEEIRPELLKSCVERAAPRLQACGGSRRLWSIAPSAALGAALRAALELETTQQPSLAIDSHSDCVIGWEIEGMSLPRVAADLIDNQRDIASLAARLHTRLDIAWRS